MIWFLIIAVVCFSVGHLHGYLMGTKVKNLLNQQPSKPEPKFIRSPDDCKCGHGRQTHKSVGSGGCSVKVAKGEYGWCACRVFVGKSINNPNYVEPVTPEKGLLEL